MQNKKRLRTCPHRSVRTSFQKNLSNSKIRTHLQCEQVQIFAHRGLYGGNIPENSHTAFQRASDAGFGIELDVRLTKDGVPVVFHDRTLRRMCGDPRRVSKVTLEELMKLRLDATEERIPTLKQTLELIDGEVPLLIETKPPKRRPWNRRLEKQMLPMLLDYRGEYLIQSFNKYSVRFLKRHLPRIECGILSGSLYPEPHSFDFISYKLNGLTREKTAELRKKYPRILAWSALPMTDHEIREALELLGLDGIICSPQL